MVTMITIEIIMDMIVTEIIQIITMVNLLNIEIGDVVTNLKVVE